MNHIKAERIDFAICRGRDPLEITKLKQQAEKNLRAEIRKAVDRQIRVKYVQNHHGSMVTSLRCEVNVHVLTDDELEAIKQESYTKGLDLGASREQSRIMEKLFR